MVGKVDACFYGSTSHSTASEMSPNSASSVRRQLTALQGPPTERPQRLRDTAVLTFDVYGTLVDRESGIISALMPWLHDVGVTAGRSEILRAFSLAERKNLIPGISYRDVLVRVHQAIAEFFGVTADDRAAGSFADSIGRWPVHPDAPAALAYLKQHFKLIALTNKDHASFDQTNEALGVVFDAVYTAEDARSFKPHTGMFAYLLNRVEETGMDRRHVLHVAGSIRFDHVPAKRLAMKTCWVHRNSGLSGLASIRKQGVDVRPDFRFRTLGGLADAHWAEVRGG